MKHYFTIVALAAAVMAPAPKQDAEVPAVLLEGPGLSVEKQRQITDALTAKGIPYLLRDSSILVRSEDRDRATVSLAGEGLFRDPEVFRWLAQVDLTRSADPGPRPFVERRKAAAEEVRQRVRDILIGVYPEAYVAVCVELNGYARSECEQWANEERSFSLRKSKRLNESTGESVVEYEPHPHTVVRRKEWAVGSVVEYVGVSVVIPEKPDRPVPATDLAKIESAVRTLAGDGARVSVFALSGPKE
jgi:hypothetical protein